MTIRSCRANREKLSTFFKYSREFCKIIYTTNIFENYYCLLRKATRRKSILPSDDCSRCIIGDDGCCEEVDDVGEKLGNILPQLAFHFSGRVDVHLQ
uniref:hypothetical protein n=1 Tax=Tumebacillus algifaecis TaxID=1214604 RepID=UPI001D132370|nr:hypothetical protein [Tumebacillus algifaecis]